jgi:hypothetical protein
MASTIKVDNIQDQCGANIANKCGTTITLGASGDTITLACGASQTGFGRTGTVDWDTTAKTASFTAVSGNGYFVNTTSGAITLTLPATPSAGDIVAFKDYAFTFATNNLTVDGNGSPIGGATGTTLPTYSTNGTSKTFIYVDGTKGWLVTNESTDTSQEANLLFVTATGGTIITCGNFKTHVFTSPGTFCVSCAGNACGSNTVDYLVVAGGGGTSGDRSGGGGAGGFRVSNSVGCVPAPTMSPLTNPTGLPVTATGYPITVGSGGAAASPAGAGGSDGSNSIFSSITSTGGGAGGPFAPGGKPGGSGGGGYAPSPGGSGNTPPVSPPQGNDGGAGGFGGPNYGGGGGGGAGAAGSDGTSSVAGAGGDGSFIAETFIGTCAPSYGTPGPVGSTRYFAGGGSGGTFTSAGNSTSPAGGGGRGAPSSPGVGVAGTVNTGGGSGGGSGAGVCGSGGNNGGSGIVIIRYKFQ